MILYGIKACDTCRKALKALQVAGAAPAFHDLRVDGVDRERLKAWAGVAGWEALVNTRSTTWRGLDDGAKSGLTESKAIALMAANPTLVKRPVIEANGEITVGWTKAVQASYGF